MVADFPRHIVHPHLVGKAVAKIVRGLKNQVRPASRLGHRAHHHQPMRAPGEELRALRLPDRLRLGFEDGRRRRRHAHAVIRCHQQPGQHEQ